MHYKRENDSRTTPIVRDSISWHNHLFNLGEYVANVPRFVTGGFSPGSTQGHASADQHESANSSLEGVDQQQLSIYFGFALVAHFMIEEVPYREAIALD